MQPKHVSTFLEGSLAQMTLASRCSNLEEFRDKILPSIAVIAILPLPSPDAAAISADRLSLSLATICSGNLRWDQRGTFSPLSVTNCMHNLICVSTRDLAPVSGTPSTLICSFLKSHICQDMRDLSRVYFKAMKNNSAYFESND